ncbi:hypothetical protein J4477_04660 [Candidatus Pacearchaeota archaeon]|nr:hypothetical protein [Candidatus Pacearchaeota archaeon]
MSFKEFSKYSYPLIYLLVFISLLSFVSAQSSCNSDLQCGFTGFFGSEFCKNDDVYKNYQSASCDSNLCSVEIEERLVNDCDDGDDSTLDECVQEANLAKCKHSRLECQDSDDCGDITEHFFCQSGDVWHQVNNPECNPNNQCTFNSFEELFEDCQYGCNNAQCISQISCSSDNDCPSPTNSDNFCFNDDVVRENIDYTCIYPGTPASYCQQNTQQELVESCDDECSNGKCVDDNNKKTSRGGIRNFNDLDPLFFEKEEPQTFGVVIPAYESNETTSSVAKTSSNNGLWILFWLLLFLILILLVLLVVYLTRRR